MIEVKRIGHATFETPDIDRQIDYFTQVAGLVLAERAERPGIPGHQARRSRGATGEGRYVALRAASRFRSLPAPTSTTSAAASRPRACAARCATTRAPAFPRSSRSTTRRAPRSRCSPSRRPITNKRASVAGHRPAQTRPSGVRRGRAENLRRVLRQGAGLPRLGLDRRLVRVHALRAGPPHLNFVRGKTTKMHHVAFELRDTAQLLAACDFLGSAEDPDHLGTGTARARPQRLYLSPQSRTTRSSRRSANSTRCSTKSSAISIRGPGTATVRRSRRSGTMPTDVWGPPPTPEYLRQRE